jgi:membrane associated rhomboid family serine protease/antitoxin component YwqK of YwqJK toxin-antitoxin module
MENLRKIPATSLLILINVIVFVLCYFATGTFDEPAWSNGLMKYGALFNPLALDREWYRILTSMFLHGHVPHLILNMYGLYSVGSQVEKLVGTKKFLAVYFISGIAGGIASLSYHLFTFGVGASGAIFGIFGFAVIVFVFLSRRQGISITPILVNFVIFLGINIALAELVNADNAAHFGGLGAGMAIGLYSMFSGSPFVRVRVEYVLLAMLVIIFFLLPRFQVEYFRFFNSIIALEERSKTAFGKNQTDAEYLAMFREQEAAWDSIRSALDAFPSVPKELEQDTFKLRRYIALRKKESYFRKTMVERESYIYIDSVGWVQDTIQAFLQLDHRLKFNTGAPEDEKEIPSKEKPAELSKVWYDKDWIELPGPPGVYFRIGSRDSLGRWQGRVQDYYADGLVQMKGVYKDDKRHGIFLYYSDHHTYTSAGRYQDDRSVGKWETYHINGRLESEVYYTDGYFLKNLWDSTGRQVVSDGRGRVTELYPNGIVSLEGEYEDGHRQGYWYGRHTNGEMYFEENYLRGRLVSGRSRSLAGKEFIYDETSLFPLPVEGYIKLNSYLAEAANAMNSQFNGQVRISFRVTAEGKVTDLLFEPHPGKEEAEKLTSYILKGPKWNPAREHGQKPVDGFAQVTVTL